MDAALVAGAALMGLAGTPHCAAMCGAPCAALARGDPRALWAWQAGRLASYAAAGALVAASVQALAALGPALPALRALWALMQAAVFALGVWLLVAGRWPAWSAARAALPRVRLVPSPAPAAPVCRVAHRTLGALAAGSGWALLPCGLLQSALLVAALTNSPAQGALAMAGFGVASAGGPLLAPLLLRRLGRRRDGAQRGPTRAAGALLAAASGWALAHGVWQQIELLCA